jgi:hypothetical protein
MNDMQQATKILKMAGKNLQTLKLPKLGDKWHLDDEKWNSQSSKKWNKY